MATGSAFTAATPTRASPAKLHQQEIVFPAHPAGNEKCIHHDPDERDKPSNDGNGEQHLGDADALASKIEIVRTKPT